MLLFVLGVMLVGCDGTGSRQESLYQRLVRTETWTVERLDGEGSFDPGPRFDQRYDWVRFDFRSGEGGRTYKATAKPTGDTTRVLASGPVALRGDQLLIMTSGFLEPNGLQRPVAWTYDFDASRAIFRLPENQQNGSRAFLSTLLPATGWSESDGVRLQLAPADEQ